MARPYRSGPIADLTWDNLGEPSEVTFSVVDIHGQPIPGVAVSIASDSGDYGGEATNENGFTRFDSGEPEVTGMKLNGVVVMRERMADWWINVLHLGGPESRGLRVRIVVKDRAALGLPAE